MNDFKSAFSKGIDCTPNPLLLRAKKRRYKIFFKNEGQKT